jgi:hypothetical protein
MNNDVCNRIHVALQRAADASGAEAEGVYSGFRRQITGKVAPYALLELILPGGSMMALLLWFYRRQRKVPVFASQENLSFL